MPKLVVSAAVLADLRALADPEKRKILSRFFKTGPGEYGEGDRFLGITVPKLRRLARKYARLDPAPLRHILRSPCHEARLLALLIWVAQFSDGDERQRHRIFSEYLKNTKYINNWDLVDLSADKIAGAYLFDKDKNLLFRLARSKDLWERRIAVMATFYFIKNGYYDTTFELASSLLTDPHDLIHKAVGWMLREIGKRDFTKEDQFLRQHYHAMPRTMLRYAIERFPEKQRQDYLNGTIS